MQHDPLGYVDGLNLSMYAIDNPTNMSDPYGLFFGVAGLTFLGTNQPIGVRTGSGSGGGFSKPHGGGWGGNSGIPKPSVDKFNESIWRDVLGDNWSATSKSGTGIGRTGMSEFTASLGPLFSKNIFDEFHGDSWDDLRDFLRDKLEFEDCNFPFPKFPDLSKCNWEEQIKQWTREIAQQQKLKKACEERNRMKQRLIDEYIKQLNERLNNII